MERGRDEEEEEHRLASPRSAPRRPARSARQRDLHRTQIRYKMPPRVYGGAPKSVVLSPLLSDVAPTHRPSSRAQVRTVRQVGLRSRAGTGTSRHGTSSLPSSLLSPSPSFGRPTSCAPQPGADEHTLAQYHKLCLKCVSCGKLLEPRLLVDHDGEVRPSPAHPLRPPASS